MTEYAVPPQPEHKPKRGLKKFLIPIAALLLGVFLGAGIGAAGAEPEVVTKEVIKEVPVEVIKEVEKEVEVEVPVTPDSCLEALDTADTAFGLMSDALGVSNEVIDGVTNIDLAAVEAATAKLDPINAELEVLVPVYQLTKASCRSS